MGFITGIKAATEKLAERAPREDYADRVKTVYASLDDGQSAKVVVLQELDEGSPNYNSKLGTGLFVLKHANPDNWQKSAECTLDDGACWACEQGWYQKVELLVNVLMEKPGEDPYVAVLAKGTGKGSVGKELLSIAADEDYDNSVSDKTFKFTRNGKGTDTTYTFSNLGKPHKHNLEDYADKLFDLTQVPFKVKYEKQEAYYLDGQEPAKKEEKPAPKSASSVDQDW